MPSLTEAYQAFIQMAEAKAQRKPYASNLALLEAARNCQKQLSGEAPLVWTRCTVPQELIAAFGAVPVFAEMACTVIGLLRQAPVDKINLSPFLLDILGIYLRNQKSSGLLASLIVTLFTVWV